MPVDQVNRDIKASPVKISVQISFVDKDNGSVLANGRQTCGFFQVEILQYDSHNAESDVRRRWPRMILCNRLGVVGFCAMLGLLANLRIAAGQATLSEPLFNGGLAQSVDSDDTQDPDVDTGTYEALPPPISVQRPRTRLASPQDNLITQNYLDGKKHIEREVIQDAEGNYVNHGRWEVFAPDGQTAAKGQYKFGKLDGVWERWHQAEQGLFATKPFNLFEGPFRSVASFKDGNLNGNWTIYDRYQRKVFEINYHNGQRDGIATWWYPNNATMRQARFEKGVINGSVIDLNENEKEIRRDVYKQGRKVVLNTTFYRPGAKKTEDQFLDPVLVPAGQDDWWEAKPTPYVPEGVKIQDGPSNAWYENGQPKSTGNYRQGKPVGQFTWWHRNGNKQIEGRYIDGKKAQRWIWWHPNGMKKFEGVYKNDQPVGRWRSWNIDGKLEKEEDFSKSTSPPDNESVDQNDVPETRPKVEAEPASDPPAEKNDASPPVQPATGRNDTPDVFQPFEFEDS